jgi:oligopeptide transport system permease protein
LIRFLAGRLVAFVLTLAAVVAVSFVMMRAARGGPFDAEQSVDPAIERNLRSRYHLDWSLGRQLAQYVGPLNLDEHRAALLGGDGVHVFGGVLAGDFGPSLRYRDQSVGDLLAQSLPVSLALGSAALLWGVLAGLAAGVASAVRRGTRTDLVLRLLATTFVALPNFVVASGLVLGLALLWPLLPVAGWGSWRHLVLPSLALGAPIAASVARLARTGMLETLSQDFVVAARGKGMPERIVLLRHALPGALVPVASYLGPAAAGVLTGSLVIERIFAIPGAGSHFVNSALNRDYTLAMGVTIVYCALVYGLNTLVDVLHRVLDPRSGDARSSSAREAA